MAKVKSNLLGAWAFLAGVIIAIIVSFITTSINPTLVIVLAFIGLVVGLLNVGGKEMTTFLLAAVSLVIVADFGTSALGVIPYLEGLLINLKILFVPATIVVALRALFAVSKA